MNAMKAMNPIIRHALHALTAILCLSLLTGCKESIDESARYINKQQTVADYLTKHEQFSEYVRLMKETPLSSISETTVFQLMTAYGYYTVFAPTNDAIQLYLDSLAIQDIIPAPSWDAFPTEKMRDSIRNVIVLNSILDGTKINKAFMVYDFPRSNNEEFSVNTMYDRKISVLYSRRSPDSIWIDAVCPIDVKNRNIPVKNGCIHQVGYCICPSNKTLGIVLRNYASDPQSGLSVMGKLIEACHLVDTLNQVRDETYEFLMQTGAIDPTFDVSDSHFHGWPNPQHRKYGFTIFAETDSFWVSALGKDIPSITVADVREWVVSQGFYPDARNDEDYDSEANVLNQFVTYHLLPYRLAPEKLVIHYNEKGYNYRSSVKPSIPVWAHYPCMGKRRLVRLWESLESNGVFLNRFPVLDNARHGNYHEVSCAPENEGIYLNTDADSKMQKLINAVIYPIDKPMVYDQRVRTELHKTRIRYDILDFTQEMMNNDMRDMGYGASFHFTSDEIYKYFDNLWVNTADTYFYVLNGWGSDWPNYQADEVCTEGLYDCTWKVPPVPEDGVYEIRMGVSTESGWRGICQIYFGTNRENLVPTGIPVDMAMGGTYRNLDGKILPSIVGWEQDTEDDDYNAELDKKMRNNGFMKGPEYIVENPGSSVTNRMQEKSTRRIITRQMMRADETYYLRFKTVQDLHSKQLFIDYLEWCPKEIYDNPNEPEDIW